MEDAEKETRWILREKKLSQLTHFGHQYTHQGNIAQLPSEQESEIAEQGIHNSRRRRSENGIWNKLNQNVIDGLYRHYWLDFVLLGYNFSEIAN